MISKKRLVIMLIFVFLTGMPSLSFGFGSMSGRGRPSEKFIERLAKDIGLTDQQKDKLLAGSKKIEAEEREIRSQNKEIYAQIKKELLKDSPDRKVISDYIQRISQNNAQIQIKRMDQIIDMRKDLTPEQKTKLEKLMGEKKAHRIGNRMRKRWDR